MSEKKTKNKLNRNNNKMKYTVTYVANDDQTNSVKLS